MKNVPIRLYTPASIYKNKSIYGKCFQQALAGQY